MVECMVLDKILNVFGYHNYDAVAELNTEGHNIGTHQNLKFNGGSPCKLQEV